MDDARWAIAATTWQAVQSFFPTGAGFGTFVPVYAHFERLQDILPDRYVNHAHNEWLQLFLETGLLGMIVVAAAGFALFTRAAKVWSNPDRLASPVDVTMARAAAIILVLVSLHSLVEFPMRTAAIAVTLAFCAGLLFAPGGCDQGADSTESTASVGRGSNPAEPARQQETPRSAGHAGPIPRRQLAEIQWPTTMAADKPDVTPAAPPQKRNEAGCEQAARPASGDEDWPEEWRPKPEK
jgi:O-antigen ligase